MARQFPSTPADPKRRVSTGIAGLDDVLGGGFLPNRLYLVEGTPGTGKTTVALRFLLEGAAHGESVLYVTLSETAQELRATAASHGWLLDKVPIFELASAEALLHPDRELTLLHPWEIELGETIRLILDEVEQLNAKRIVFDSLSEMRLLTQDPLRYRRQIVMLKQHFASKDCTVLLLDDRAEGSDLELHSVVHGVVTLEQRAREFGAERRRLRVMKMRGTPFRGGWHDFVIRHGGLAVFPRLVAAEHPTAVVGDPVGSGVAGLDALLDGGPLRGTTTLIVGAAGAGKTSLATQYALAAADRGERAAFYTFDERLGTLLTRSAKLGLDLQPEIDAGRMFVDQVDPAELSPGEFTHRVCRRIDADGAKVLVIDSLNGYMHAMPQEDALLLQMHELLSYLNQRGVASFLVLAQHGLVGQMQTSLEISYLSDAVLLLRYFEAAGRVRKALSVIKNRSGGHEDTIRELQLGPDGIAVGEPLTTFHGVLTGNPTYTGEIGGEGSLLTNSDENGHG